MTTSVAHAAALRAWPEGKENPGASDTGSSTTGRDRWTTSLATRPRFQAAIIVAKHHQARVRRPARSQTHRHRRVPTA